MNAIRTPMYDQNAAVAALNHVEGFDPKQYMRTTSTEEGQGLYLDVKYRKLWFRLAHPLGKIKKIFHALNAEVAICEARVYLNKDDPEDQYIGSGTAQRFFKAGDKFGESYVESAETAAVGRALAEAGFGSQFSDCDVTEPADTPPGRCAGRCRCVRTRGKPCACRAYGWTRDAHSGRFHGKTHPRAGAHSRNTAGTGTRLDARNAF